MKRKVVFIKNEDAQKYCKGSYPDNEMLIRINCEFLEQKISEGFDPVSFDFQAGGFYFIEPEPFPEFESEEIFVSGTGEDGFVLDDEKSEVRPGRTIILNKRVFSISSSQHKVGGFKVAVVGKFLD